MYTPSAPTQPQQQHSCTFYSITAPTHASPTEPAHRGPCVFGLQTHAQPLPPHVPPIPAKRKDPKINRPDGALTRDTRTNSLMHGEIAGGCLTGRVSRGLSGWGLSGLVAFRWTGGPRLVGADVRFGVGQRSWGLDVLDRATRCARGPWTIGGAILRLWRGTVGLALGGSLAVRRALLAGQWPGRAVARLRRTLAMHGDARTWSVGGSSVCLQGSWYCVVISRYVRTVAGWLARTQNAKRDKGRWYLEGDRRDAVQAM